MSEGLSFGVDVIVCSKLLEKGASVGVLEDEDVVRSCLELLIGFITLKGNILAVS